MARQGEKNALFKLLRREGVKREQPLIVATVKAFAEGRVRVENQRIVNNRRNAIEGYSLTREIDEILQKGSAG